MVVTSRRNVGYSSNHPSDHWISKRILDLSSSLDVIHSVDRWHPPPPILYPGFAALHDFSFRCNCDRFPPGTSVHESVTHIVYRTSSSRGGFYRRSFCLPRCFGLFFSRRHDRRDGVISASCGGNDVQHVCNPRAPPSETLD